MRESLLTPKRALGSQSAMLASLALCGMFVPLNSTMIAVALPDIITAFGVDVEAGSWLVSAYLVTMAAFQLLAGKLGDQFGRRRAVLTGLTGFGLSSLLATLSPNLLTLLAARVFQAIAGSILITNAISTVFASVPEERRGRDLGTLSAILVLAAAAGPSLAGLLVSLAGWRAIFWINLPLVLAALLTGWSSIPESEPGQRTGRRLDWLEVPKLFRGLSFASANGAILFGNLSMYVMLLAVPILLISQEGVSSLQSGLALSVMSVAVAVLTPVGGRLSDRIGRRRTSLAGSALLATGSLALLVLRGGIYLPLLLAGLGLMGMGLGMSSVSLQTTLLESAELGQAGLVTAIASTSRYLGSILGANLLAQILRPAPFEAGRTWFVFLLVAASAGLTLLMTWGIRDRGVQASQAGPQSTMV